MLECDHIFVPTALNISILAFRINRMISSKPVTHVRCDKCNCRTWLTKEQFREHNKIK